LSFIIILINFFFSYNENDHTNKRNNYGQPGLDIFQIVVFEMQYLKYN